MNITGEMPMALIQRELAFAERVIATSAPSFLGTTNWSASWLRG